MTDAVLQVLLILAYLAIGLISVTFPIYAISVNYLPQEKWESKKDKEKRMKKLRSKISELTAELKGEEHDSERVAELKEQIEKYETELEGTELGIRYLTAEGAVRNPIIGLIIALVAAGVGIHFFYEGNQQNVAICGFISGLLCALAVLNLYKTISAVEYAVLRPARTIDFNVGFDKIEKKVKKMKLRKEIMLGILANTYESDIENFFLNVRFPPEIEIPKRSESQNIIVAHHRDCTVIGVSRDFLPKGVPAGFITGAVAKRIGKYIIDVKVHAKGFYENNKQLTINVVK